MFRKRPVEKVIPSMSRIQYASFIYPAAFIVVGSVYSSDLRFWGLTKRHAAYRAQRFVQNRTGFTIPIYKSIKHHNKMLSLRKAYEAAHSN